MSSHSLKTQMVTQYAQSGPPGARCNGIACWQGETAILRAPMRTFCRPDLVDRLAAAVLSLNRGKIYC